MTQWNRLFVSLAAVAALTGSFACMNVFKPIDSPSGDRQNLSAARAAFDRGDIAKAREYYGKVSADESSTAELIFVDLDSCGADIDAFATALSQGSGASSNPGVMATVMAEKMNARVGTSCFATLLAAFKRARAISDANLRGFSTFLASLAIAGEVLGSNSNIVIDGVLNKADFIGNPATCTTFPGSCASCPKADGIVQNAGGTVDLTAAATIQADWGVFQGAINAANTGLTELGISSGPSFTLITSILGSGAPTNDANYRCLLTSIGVGR
jgi:hypothetical protein